MLSLTRLALFAVFLTGSVFLLVADLKAQSPDLAISGYDPVSYFTGRRPVEGSASHSTVHNGRTYHFATAENKARFVGDPERYAPRYDGYCAFGVARGYKVGIDPLSYKVVDGALYLNYSRSVQRQWSRDIPGFIAQANAKWPALKN
ncbi:YHS domain-containing (seleno)protein [Roseibium aquae]|nr:YHS domain-containing (seleno)protein [Roseibium aquae]